MQNTVLEEKLNKVREILKTAQQYDHAVNVLMYDQETICPPDAMEEQGETMAFLSNQSYRLIKDPAFIEAAECMNTGRNWESSTGPWRGCFTEITSRRRT